MVQYKGVSKSAEVSTQQRRKDVRTGSRRFRDRFEAGDGVIFGLFLLPCIALVLVKIPMSGELMLLLTWLFKNRFIELKGRGFDFPFRVPMQAHVGDGSYPMQKNQKSGAMEWRQGSGITYLAQDTETQEQVYSSDSDLRTHMLVLGTTGSGKPQGVNANILTPKGWRKMGSLVVGDIVSTPDGKSAPIVRIFEQGVRQLFRLRLRDGRKAEGTGDHPWRVLVRHADGREEAQTATTDHIGELMKAGAKVRFNMHYHAIGEPVVDRTEVGIVFYPKGVVPAHVITTILSPNQDDLDIPAGADNVRSDAYFKIDKPSHLVGFMPHMHNRGKRQCLEAIYPDMRVEQLNCVNYDFNWQIVYNYADTVAPLLPAGTIMHVISWHDNSAANKYNPDPRNWVGFGNRTTDDMSRHWLTFYTMSDDEFKAEVAARNALKVKSTAAQ